MAILLKGSEVIGKLNSDIMARVEEYKAKNITLNLAIIRVGERGEDIAYERSAIKRCESLGIPVQTFTLEESASQDELLEIIEKVNNDDTIHGVLLFRPLPKHIDDNIIRNALSPLKDADCITDGSLAGLFADLPKGFPPCTPCACMEMLKHYNIDLIGKKVVVIGRSLVVGKPVALMLVNQNATVTIAHSKTVDLPKVCQDADILIVAAGRAEMINKDYIRKGQVIIDVGINFNEEGKIKGDVNFEDAEPLASAISPVPGGVGAVTTSILAQHVIEAADRVFQNK